MEVRTQLNRFNMDKLLHLIEGANVPDDYRQEMLDELNRYRMLRWWGGYADALRYALRHDEDDVAIRLKKVNNNLLHLEGRDDEMDIYGLYLL